MIADIDCDVRWNGTAWKPFAGKKPRNSAAANSALGNVTAASWANLSTNLTCNLDLPFPAVVKATLQCWMVGAAGTDIRAGTAVTGATTSAPEAGAWGEVALLSGAVNSKQISEKTVECAAGTNTFTAKTYRAAGSGNVQINYAKLDVEVIEWL